MTTRQKDDPDRLLAGTYPLHVTIPTRYSDIDAFRHINNVAIAGLFEEGRVGVNARVFGTGAFLAPAAGAQLLLAGVTIDYLRQTHYPGEVIVASGVKEIGRSSFRIAQAMFQDGECTALGEGVMVKGQDGRGTALSSAERDMLQSLLLKA